MGKKIWYPMHPRNFGSHVTVRPPDQPSVPPQANQCKITQSTGKATRGYFGGKSQSHPRLVKQRRKGKAEILSESVLSKVSSID